MSTFEEEIYTETSTVFSALGIGTYKYENVTYLKSRDMSLYSSNSLNENYYDYDSNDDETFYRVLTWCVYTTVFVTGCCGNILVLFLIHRCRQLKGVPAMLLVSLAVADFLVCFIIVPAEMYTFYATEFHLGPFVCKFLTLLHQLVFACSSFTLTLISIERLYVVKYPLRARSVITTRRARFVIAGVWLSAALCAVPNTYRQIYQRHVWDIHSWATCSPSVIEPWKKINAMFDFLVTFIFPVLIMGVAYTIGTVTLCKSTRKSKRLQGIKMSNNVIRESAERQQADKNQAILMLFIVVLLYILTWGPFMIFQLLGRFDVINVTYEGHMRLTYTLTRMLGIGNSCMNPFLYVFMSKGFRSSINTTLCCTKTTDVITHNIGHSVSGGLNSSRTVTSRYIISEV
ncbi:type-1 angiotensin II receptor A-like [Antedon mediterranea]|uniref:type-1 angiotensin II receptor A-like n=1 Tax=Antedon mediterranea TaxID=105859 RepID=UPI003AF8C5B6